jgi:hypothetical protein
MKYILIIILMILSFNSFAVNSAKYVNRNSTIYTIDESKLCLLSKNSLNYTSCVKIYNYNRFVCSTSWRFEYSTANKFYCNGTVTHITNNIVK